MPDDADDEIEIVAGRKLEITEHILDYWDKQVDFDQIDLFHIAVLDDVDVHNTAEQMIPLGHCILVVGSIQLLVVLAVHS